MTAATTGWLLVRWLAVAYAIESLMIKWLPVGAVGEWLGAGAGPLAVPLAVGIGIPVYLNSCAAIPFISGLIGLGMSPATVQIHYRIEGAGAAGAPGRVYRVDRGLVRMRLCGCPQIGLSADPNRCARAGRQ
jgi:hypothetical protein